jgi:hypothetical protein
VYQFLSGEPIKVFVDRNDIKWGEEWLEKINATIFGTTFFIADFVVMLDRKRHRGIQLGCSSSVRAWSIWSLGVRRGRGHRLTLAGERFVGSGLRGRCGIFHLLFLWIKEALLSVLTAVIPVLLPLREVVPELADLHREERVHSKIQPVPYDLCTHSEQERETISKRQGDLVPVPCCCRGTAMCN